jgi:anti-sigma B factor antagonist
MSTAVAAVVGAQRAVARPITALELDHLVPLHPDVAAAENWLTVAVSPAGNHEPDTVSFWSPGGEEKWPAMDATPIIAAPDRRFPPPKTGLNSRGKRHTVGHPVQARAASNSFSTSTESEVPMPQSSSSGPAPFSAVMETPFTTHVTQSRPGEVTVAVSGELDLATRPRLDRAVRDVLAARPWHLTIDLTAVTFCGSAGLQVLLVLHRVAGEAGVRMVVQPSPAIRRLLEITGLADVVPIVTHAAEPAPRRTDTFGA